MANKYIYLENTPLRFARYGSYVVIKDLNDSNCVTIHKNEWLSITEIVNELFKDRA